MKKQIPTLKLLGLTLLFCVSQIVLAQVYSIDGINYSLFPDTKQATVVQSYSKYSGNIVIPQQVSYNDTNYEVTTIGEKAFYACTGLTSITLPNTITDIKQQAFDYCTSLTSVHIPKKVKVIAERAFRDCENIKTVTFDEDSELEEIQDRVFYRCIKLENCELPAGVKVLSHGAFGLTGLKEITLPAAVETLGYGVFQGCASLERFFVAPGNTHFAAEDGVLMSYDKKTLLAFGFPPNAPMELYQLPKSVELVKTQAFSDCMKLRSVVSTAQHIVFEGVTFYCCFALTDVFIYADNPPGFELDKGSGFTLHLRTDVTAAENPNYNIQIVYDLTPNSVHLGDKSQGFMNQAEEEGVTITYSRKFTNTQWQPFFLPFDMPYNVWSPDCEVAALVNFDREQDENGEATSEGEVMNFRILGPNSTALAHTPYLIRAKEECTKVFTVENAILYPADNRVFTVETDMAQYTLKGAYEPIQGLMSMGVFVMGSGKFHRVATDDATLGSYRWYMEIVPKNDIPVQGLRFAVYEDNEITSTGTLRLQPETPTQVFSLDGRRVTTPIENLPKGIYLINGQKVLK